MDNRFAFGLWIYLDLTVIALGAGAFFTGFLLYVLKQERAQGGHQQRGRHRLHLLQRRGRDPDDRRRASRCAPGSPSGTRTSTRCSPRSPSASPATSPSSRSSTLPLVLRTGSSRARPSLRPRRIQAAQVMVVFALRGHVPLLLPPGLARRALRRPARRPVRLPRAHRHLADDVLPLHPLGRGGRPELHPPDDLARRRRSRGSASSPRRSSRPSRRSPAGSSSSTSS